MSLIKSTLTVSIGIATSRIFGFIRDVLIAKYLGASMLSDVFFAAFRLPNFFRRIFAEGAFNSAFVPLFIKINQEEQNKLKTTKNLVNSIIPSQIAKIEAEKSEAKIFAANIFSFLFYALLIFILLAQIFMPQIIGLLFPGFKENPEKFLSTVQYSRITIFYLLFIAIVSLFSGILNSLNKFFIASTTPIILNLTLILMMIFASKFFANYAQLLSFSVVIAGVLQVAWISFFTIKCGFLLYPKMPIFNLEAKKFFRKLLPGIIGANVLQINLLIDSIFASAIIGAVSYLYYADRINQLPLAMIGIAFSVSLLPNLSRKIKNNLENEAINLQNIALEIALILIIPILINLVVFAYQIIQLLFERGSFNNANSVAVSNALMLYSLGLPSFIMVKIFEPAFFARGNTKTPMKISIFCVSLNLALNLLFHYFNFGYLGIILAAIISSYFNLFLLIKILIKWQHFFFKENFIKHFLLILAIGVATLIFAVFLKQEIYQNNNLFAGFNNFFKLITSLFLVLIFNLFALYFCGGMTILKNLKK